MKKIEFNYSNPGFLIGFAAFVISATGLFYAQSIVTPFLLALFISIICTQPVLWLQRKKVPQWLSITLVFVGIITVFFGFGALIGSSLSSFSANAHLYEENLQNVGNSILEGLNEKGFLLSKSKLTKLFDPSKIMGLTAGLLGQLGGIMGNAFTIFFLALFLLMELDSFSIKTKVISRDSKGSLNFLNTIGKSIRHYLSIKTFTSLLTGALIWIGLKIIGVDYAIIWALIAFLLNYIPNFGSIIASVPAVLFSLVQLGVNGMLWTTLIFILVNMIIGNIVEPKVMGRGLGLSTFIVFVSLIFWGFLLGTVGMFLSVPITMATKIMLEQDPNTKWVAVILGTQEEAETLYNNEQG